MGKPGNYHHGIDKEGHIKPMTIGARLYRLENQVYMKNSFEKLNWKFHFTEKIFWFWISDEPSWQKAGFYDPIAPTAPPDAKTSTEFASIR